ncbi:DUF6907 domain-containing protein [Nocardia sp. NPDC101769]|uniref:DUF6907 domain-containing protein n=1 Tax=Nocardia sp. NPDC101769 TaxID=3364333 RepID=UPI00381548F2
MVPDRVYAEMTMPQAFMVAEILFGAADLHDLTSPVHGNCPLWCATHQDSRLDAVGRGAFHCSRQFSVEAHGPELRKVDVSISVLAIDAGGQRTLTMELVVAGREPIRLTAAEARQLAVQLLNAVDAHTTALADASATR